MSERLTRRGFVIAAAGTLAAPVVGAGGQGCADDASDDPPLTPLAEGVAPAGNVDQLTTDDWTAREVVRFPGQRDAGTETVYLRLAGGGPDGEPEVEAVSSRCTHLGCPVRYVSATANFICSC